MGFWGLLGRIVELTGGASLDSNVQLVLNNARIGADIAVAVSNAAMQAVGCIAARMCNSNNCPVGVATLKPELRKRLDMQIGAERLARYFGATVELMDELGQALPHDIAAEPVRCHEQPHHAARVHHRRR